jgi:hypothetical protein
MAGRVHAPPAGELRQRAQRYRRLKTQISDSATVQAICQLAGEYEMTAAELEKRHLTLERAHEIWIEHGRPSGRDMEFWLAAERDLAGEDMQARRVSWRA